MAKQIKLTQGKVAIVDEAIYEYLLKYKFHAVVNSGITYAKTYVKRIDGSHQAVYLHHIVIGRPMNGLIVDHINGKGEDNRLSNLRITSFYQNAINTKKRRKGETSSKYAGVSFNVARKRWYTRIRIKGNRILLGSYVTERQAAAVYANAFKNRV